MSLDQVGSVIPLILIPSDPVDSRFVTVYDIWAILFQHPIDLVVGQDAAGASALSRRRTTSFVCRFVEGATGSGASRVFKSEGSTVKAQTEEDFCRVDVVTPQEIQAVRNLCTGALV